MGERGLVWFMYRLPGLIVDAHSPGRPWVPKHLGSPEHQLAHDL
jgi:hypothetical protein